MRSFKEYADARDKQEGFFGDLGYMFQNWDAPPEQKAQARAIDAFGSTYKTVGPQLNKSASLMNNLAVPAADELERKVSGVGKKFDKVARKSRNDGIPVRNIGLLGT